MYWLRLTGIIMETLLALVVFLLAVGTPANAGPYFNSSESGCSGSDPNVLLCDDFEDGTWYVTNGDTSGGITNPDNDGWGATIYANPITPPGAIRCGPGVTPFGNCAANGGTKTGVGGRNMALHWFKTATCGINGGQRCPVPEVYVRWYAKWDSGYQFGAEKHMNVTNSDGDIAFVNVQLNCGAGSASSTARPALQVLYGGPEFSGCPSPSFNIQSGRWYFFELHVRAGSNGLIRLWLNDCGVDGTSCGPAPILRMQLGPGNLPGNANGSQIETIWLENWANPASAGTGPLWDQINVSRVGPIGFANSSAALPNAPTTLIAQ
jgi:hypothetical protein